MASGHIVLMGSGELTATMVEVHKEVLASLGPRAPAVFLDTPAGFQLNVDQISQKAVSYFTTKINHPLSVVSFKSALATPAAEAEHAFYELRQSRYVLIGPGSPTYAVRQWQQTPIPDILKKLVASGGCLVAASAAALTVGSYTLPVYEIYKVGEDIHWSEGIDVLGFFGIPCVVVPHWNNAEGGTHDTRFCFMGASRFRQLEALLPETLVILGLDEHTACCLDFSTGQAYVKGLGRITVRFQHTERVFERGESFGIELLTGAPAEGGSKTPMVDDMQSGVSDEAAPDLFWDAFHTCQASFEQALAQQQIQDAVVALLEFDRLLWQSQEQHEDPERIAQAREMFRELIIALGNYVRALPPSREACLKPLVEELVQLRTRLRHEKKWAEADALRSCLEHIGIAIEDSPHGSQWRFAVP